MAEFQKTKDTYALLQASIADLNALITSQGSKDGVESVIEQMNQCYDDYKESALEFLSTAEEDEKGVINKQHAEIAEVVNEIRKKANEYVHKFDDLDSSSMKAKAAAKKALLEARLKNVQLKHELEMEEQKLNQRKEMLALQMELAEAAAQDDAIKKIMDEDSEIKFGKENNNSDTSNSSQSAFYEQQKELINLLQAPKLDIPTFNGDPLKYYMFIRAFDANVQSKVSDSGARLTQLIQHCSGPALTVVQGCAIMQPTEGYETARAILAERFGNPLVIAQAWVEHITNRDQIKNEDGPALLEYADQLRTCLHTLRAMDALSEVSAQTTLLHIVGKLPTNTAGRWRKQVVHVKRNNGRLPKFEDVVSFVEVLAEEYNIPVYGNIKPKNPPKADSKKGPYRNPSSFNTSGSVTQRDKKCSLCSEAHMIWECSKFKDMTPEQRFQEIREKSLCFNCLAGTHSSRDCRSKRRCGINGCGRKHSYLLHPTKNDNSDTKNVGSDARSAQNLESSDSSKFSGFVDTQCFLGSADDKIALPIVAVKVKSKSGHKSVETFALLDSGSSHTFCSQSLINELGLSGRKETLSLTTLEKKDSVSNCEVITNLEITNLEESSFAKLPIVISRPNLPINPENLASQHDVSGFPHLAGVRLPVASSREVKLLIGLDNPDLLMPLNIIKGKQGQPWACQTKLGWTLNGPVGKSRSSRSATSHFVNISNEQLSTQMEQFWKIDTSGIFDDKLALSINDKKVMDVWDNTTVQDGENYIMQIPFKDTEPNFPNNRSMAVQRLESLDRKLQRNNELKQNYDDGINELLKNGYAMKVPDKDVKKNNGLVWYLPHHAVINPNKDKIRIVFDAAAKYAGRSLNNSVHQGPDMIAKLLGVVLRSRLRPICIMADVSAMFYQVKVSEEHQDVLRFLWRSDGDVQDYRLTRHVFGGTWSPAAACYALQKTATDHGHQFGDEASKVLKRDMYVDDLVTSVSSVQLAIKLQVELKSLLAKGGFNLTKWASNKPEVLTHLPETEKSKNMSIDYDTEVTERVLGIQWNIKEDTIGYKTLISNKPFTKRGALSVLSSVYDPIGLASPFILTARKIVQELFRQKLGWDDAMPTGLQQQWINWISDLPNLTKFKVPRCVTPHGDNKIVDRQLHHFGDASKSAYGVCSYLRQVDNTGHVSVNLIMAKSRLAPLKEITIPRLELSAAALAVKQNSLLEAELDIPINATYYWSDSMIVLKYIANENKRFHTFVANRVSMIRELSDPSNWRHVSSKENPSDLITRGLSATDLSCEMWVSGPNFLARPQEEWPSEQCDLDLTDDPEVKSVKEKLCLAINTKDSPLNELMLHYSDWFKLRRAIAWLLVLKNILRKRGSAIRYLSSDHVKSAEEAIIQYVQMTALEQDGNDLRANGVVKSASKLKPLKPFLSEGIIKIGGRLENAPISPNMKHPIVLPNEHHITQLIIDDAHKSSGHSGREYVLAEIRQNYWIVGGRGAVRKRLASCVTCKKRDAPVCTQIMAPLPADRVSPGGHPFQSTGVDIFGHFLVKRGRGTAKRYGCLFTCLASRAIHIEIVHSLEADSFIQALDRFTARRGKVCLLRSDQGTNFVAADKELRKITSEWNNDAKMHKYFTKVGIKWQFNPPYASSHGGVWERQIRTCRKVLAGLVTEQTLTDEGLVTLMCLVENVVNNRPITTVSMSPQDPEPLTPNHLLLLRAETCPPGFFKADDIYARQRYRQVHYLADVFWRRWVREYLPGLQRRTKWINETRELKAGDLVLLIDNTLPRNQWSMGRLLENVSGSKRSVQIRTKKGTVTRPINKICLLEQVSTDRTASEE